jgi:6-phosphogluconolactonase
VPTLVRRPEVVILCCILAGCGGGGGGSRTPPPAPGPQTFSVGGTVVGLEAVGLVLQNNGGPDLAISTSGSFAFPTQLVSGAPYSVTIKTQPSAGPAQVCSVTNGSGTVASSAVVDVTVTCVYRTFKFLYATSGTADTVQGFSIDAANGSVAALPAPPIPTGREPSIAIAHPSGKFLSFSTRGGGVDPPRVEVYAVDNVTGALTAAAGSPHDLGAVPVSAVVQPPVIHASGGFGYVSMSGAENTLHGATFDATTGELTEIPGMPIATGSAVTGLVFDPTGGFAFMTTSNGEVRSFLVNVPSGVLTPIGTFQTQGNNPLGAVLTPGGDHLLVPNFLSGTLMVFAVDKTAGTLTPLSMPPVSTGPAGARPSRIVYDQRTNVFYVVNVSPGPVGLAAFRFDPANGNVTPVGAPVATAGGVNGVLLHRSGRFLFQYNSSTPSIQRFSLDPTTGAPTLLPDVTTLPGAANVALVLDASGKFLYATNQTAATLSSYAIDQTTGALTLVNTVPTSPGSLGTVPFLLN